MKKLGPNLYQPRTERREIVTQLEPVGTKAEPGVEKPTSFEVSTEAPSTSALQASPNPAMSALSTRAGAGALARQIVPGTSALTVEDALQSASDAQLMSLMRSRFVDAQKRASSEPLEMGVQFVEIGRLVPGQTRIALDRVREKVAIQVKYDGFDGTTPRFDEGRATVPLEYPKPAIAGPNGMVLVIDGNHQATAAILAGADSVPIDIVGDLQHLDEAAFWKEAEKNGWLYLNEMGGKPGDVSEASYAKVDNDPLRFLMSNLALKVRRVDGQLAFEDSSRLDERVWVKMKGPTVDFVEFKLADVLYRAADNDPEVRAGLESDDRAVQAKTARAVFAREVDPASLGILLLDDSDDLASVSAKIDEKI